MAWRCEVKLVRTGEWIVYDEWPGIEGERMPSRQQYERRLLKAHPILQRREYRISEYAAPKVKPLFTLTVPLSL